jgi:hypothetical protein
MMSRICQRTVSVLALGLVALLASSAVAEGPKSVKAIHTWTGSVADRKLESEAPKSGYLDNQKTFEALWVSWNVGTKGGKTTTAPAVDFSKEVAFVAIGHGTKVSQTATLDDKGNLQATVFGTTKVVPGFRYQILVVSKAGATMINGYKLATVVPVTKSVKAIYQWTGSVADRKLESEAPKSGYLDNQKSFEALWVSWDVGTKGGKTTTAPVIDFNKEVALVAISRGASVKQTATLDDKGRLQAIVVGTTKAAPGFRYHILVVSKEGATTINSKALKE